MIAITTTTGHTIGSVLGLLLFYGGIFWRTYKQNRDEE
jgi:hypothetical protein